MKHRKQHKQQDQHSPQPNPQPRLSLLEVLKALKEQLKDPFPNNGETTAPKTPSTPPASPQQSLTPASLAEVNANLLLQFTLSLQIWRSLLLTLPLDLLLVFSTLHLTLPLPIPLITPASQTTLYLLSIILAVIGAMFALTNNGLLVLDYLNEAQESRERLRARAKWFALVLLMAISALHISTLGKDADIGQIIVIVITYGGIAWSVYATLSGRGTALVNGRLSPKEALLKTQKELMFLAIAPAIVARALSLVAALWLMVTPEVSPLNYLPFGLLALLLSVMAKPQRENFFFQCNKCKRFATRNLGGGNVCPFCQA